MNEGDHHQFTFPAVQDSRSELIGPAFGVGMIGFIAGALALTIPLAMLSSVLVFPETLIAAPAFGCSVIIGVCTGRAFLRWRRRVNRERKLVFDRMGMTYHKYARNTEVTPWEDIEQVHEEVRLNVDGEDSYTLVIRRRHGRPFRIGWFDFADYDGIKLLMSRRLAGMTSFSTPPGKPDLDLNALERALDAWGVR